MGKGSIQRRRIPALWILLVNRANCSLMDQIQFIDEDDAEDAEDAENAEDAEDQEGEELSTLCKNKLIFLNGGSLYKT